MVMADRDWPVTVPINIGNLFWSHMDMSPVMIVICFDKSDRGPVGSMSEVVLRLRQAMQVHSCRYSDAQTDAEVTKAARQIEAPVAPLPPRPVVGNAWNCVRPHAGTSIVGCWPIAEFGLARLAFKRPGPQILETAREWRR